MTAKGTKAKRLLRHYIGKALGADPMPADMGGEIDEIVDDILEDARIEARKMISDALAGEYGEWS